jgi:hypothetical protein
MPRDRWEQLAGESDWYSQQAAEAYLDGFLEPALKAADRAVRARRRLHHDDPADRQVAEVFAEGLRNRAEVLCTLAFLPTARPSETKRRAKAGIDDATRAVTLYDDLDSAPDMPYPLRAAEVRLLLSELHALAGHAEPARRQAESSLEVYRRHRHNAGNADSDVDLGRALQRYADVMTLLQDGPAAAAARRESFRVTRAHARPGAHLWPHRRSVGTAWRSTPTLERFCEVACHVAVYLDPPTRPAAPEALLALQDAAEGYCGLLPEWAFVDPSLEEKDLQYLRGALAVLQAQARWLQAVGEAHLATLSLAAAQSVAAIAGPGWLDAVGQLRPLVEEVIGRLGTPRDP